MPRAPPPILSSMLTVSVAETVSPPAVGAHRRTRADIGLGRRPTVLVPLASETVNRLASAPDWSWAPIVAWLGQRIVMLDGVEAGHALGAEEAVVDVYSASDSTWPDEVLSRSAPSVNDRDGAVEAEADAAAEGDDGRRRRFADRSPRRRRPGLPDAVASAMWASTVSWTVITSTAKPTPASRRPRRCRRDRLGSSRLSLAIDVRAPQRPRRGSPNRSMAVVVGAIDITATVPPIPTSAEVGHGAGLGAERLGRVGLDVGVAAGLGRGRRRARRSWCPSSTPTATAPPTPTMPAGAAPSMNVTLTPSFAATSIGPAFAVTAAPSMAAWVVELELSPEPEPARARARSPRRPPSS